MIRFAAPEWFLLVPALVVAGWFWPRLRLWSPLRASAAILVVLLLVRPEIRRLSSGLDLWVLTDRSASAADTIEPRLPEIEGLLEHSKRPDDRVFFIDFAEIAQVRGEADEIPAGKRQQSRLGLAVRAGLGRAKSGRAARLLALTDGLSTEPLSESAQRLQAQDVSLDYRLFNSGSEQDYRLQDLRISPRVQPGEAFLIEIEVAGALDADVPCRIQRDGDEVGSATIQVRRGSGRVRLTDRLASPGAHSYVARLAAAGDDRPGNDWQERWVEVSGAPRILLVSGYEADPLAAVLRAQNFQVEVETNPARLHPGRLSGTAAVILNNVPAYRLPPEFLGALPFYVEGQGRGLWMAGGKFSFGSGGYFQSPIDPLLPVSMELRTEHRKLVTAMAVVLDRSGSMAAEVGPGMRKMDLADEGAARCVELLSGMDAVSVFAVDTVAHEIVPLSRIGNQQANLGRTIRTIDSGGGGICVPTGLKAAYQQLKNATAGQRHVVLFADANDATQEIGDYKTLIAQMRRDGITISVIGLGAETDSGGEFLRDVARLGGGRMFFNADPMQLPALFAQETVAVARSAFLEEPVALKAAPGWQEIAARPLAWVPVVDGYNLSYLKPEAAAAALSGDEYAAPLVSMWRRGLGRVAAVSFPLGGEFSGRVRSWEGYGDFTRTLSRWLIGEQMPGGAGLRTALEGTEMTLDLRYDDSWEKKLAGRPPRILLSEGTTGQTTEPEWQRIEPGHFRAAVTLTPGRWVRGAVQLGEFTLPFGPIVAGSNVEWSVDPARIGELRKASRESGGHERVDLTGVWDAPRREAFSGIQPWLLVTLLAVTLAESFVTRVGWKLPQFHWAGRRSHPIAHESVPVEVSPPVAKAAETPDGKSDQRRSRFERAKRGR